jgi:hypothetical protein
MSKIRSFRIDKNLFGRGVTEFYFKIEDSNDHLIGNFAVAEDGIYYYRIGSQILTRQENDQTLATYEGFMSFEKLKELFEKLLEIGWTLDHGDDSLVKIERRGSKIIINKIAPE